jgi:mercuric ion transport protein
MLKDAAHHRRAFLGAFAGTVGVALCCFTPVLVIGLGIVGGGAFTPYLDLVLFPLLALLVIGTVVSYRRWKKSCACAVAPPARPASKHDRKG